MSMFRGELLVSGRVFPDEHGDIPASYVTRGYQSFVTEFIFLMHMEQDRNDKPPPSRFVFDVLKISKFDRNLYMDLAPCAEV